MADYDLSTLDATKPDGATEEVAVLDEYQRETRTKLKAWAGVEHDLATGAHVIPHGTTLPGGSTDGRLFYHETQRELIVNSGGFWRSVAQPTFNYVINGMFRQYYTAPAIGFIGWGFYDGGVGGFITRPFLQIYGDSMAQIRAGSGYVLLHQYVAHPSLPNTPFAPYTYWRNKTVTFGALVNCGAANCANLQIWDGVTGASSAAHLGGGQWQWMTVTCAMAGTADQLQISVRSNNNTINTYVAGATLVEGHSCPHPLPPSWQGRQGVLRFGHSDYQPATNTPWWYGVSGYSTIGALGIQTGLSFDAMARTFYINSVNNIGAGTLTAQVQLSGTLTPIIISMTGANNQSSTDATVYPGSKDLGWMVKVTRNGGTAGPFFAALTYDEVPAMT